MCPLPATTVPFSHAIFCKLSFKRPILGDTLYLLAALWSAVMNFHSHV